MHIINKTFYKLSTCPFVPYAHKRSFNKKYKKYVFHEVTHYKFYNCSRATKYSIKLKKFNGTLFIKDLDYSYLQLKYLTSWLEETKNLLSLSKLGNFRKNILYYVNIHLNRIDANKNLFSNERIAKIYSDKSYALLNNQEYYRACEAVKKSLKFKSNFNEALNNKGVIFYRQEKFKEACDTFEKVLTNSNYQDAYALYYKGLTLTEMSRYKEALEAFDGANSLKDYKYPEALIGKGIAFRKMEKFKDSLESIENLLNSSECISIEDVKAEALYHKGLTLTEMSRYKEALEAFDGANSLKDYKYPETLIGKGIAFRKMEKFKDSLESIERMLEISDLEISDYADAYAWYHKGLTFTKMSKYEKALEAFQKANSLKNYKYSKALIGKGIVFCKMNQFEDSLRSIEDASKSCDYIDAYDWYQIGLILTELTKYKEALEAFEEAILIFSENELYNKETDIFKNLLDIQSNQDYLYKKGLYLRNKAFSDLFRDKLKDKKEDNLETLLGMLHTSCMYLMKTTELDPENYKVYYDIGLVYRFAYEIYKEYDKDPKVIKEALERTLEFYNKAIEINLNYAEAWYDKGLSLYNLERYKESLECLNIAVDLDYNYNMAWYIKGLVHNKIEQYIEAIRAFNTALEVKDKDKRIKEDEKFILLNEGISYYELRNYDKALILFQKVNDKDPEPLALNNIGLIHYSRKEYINALKCFEKAISVGEKKNTYALNNRGLTLGKCGKFNEAIKCFSCALENESQKDAYAWYYKGLSHFNLKEYSQAIECFDKAIEYDEPNSLRYVGALTNKAFALYKLGKYKLAKKCFKKTIILCDKATCQNSMHIAMHIDALNNKAIAFRELGELDLSNRAFQEVLKLYDKKLENDPQDIDALYDKGIIYHNLKDYVKALKFFDKAININQDYGMAWYYKGVALYSLTYYYKAIEAFDKSIRCFEIIDNQPSIRNATYNKALAYCNLKEYDKAEQLFSKHQPLVNLSNDKIEDLYYEIGLFRYNVRDYKTALSCFQKVVDLNKNSLLGWYYKGIVHDSLGTDFDSLEQHFQAIAAFDEALDLNPDSPDIWYQKGISLFNCRKYLEATKAFDESIRLNPDSPDPWYRKGICFISINSPIEAIDSFEKSIQIYNKQLEENPGYLFGWYNKSLILYDIGKFDEAEQAFKKVIQIISEVKDSSSEPKLLEQKGITLFYLTEYEESIMTLKKAMELNPSNTLLSEYKDIATLLSMLFKENGNINYQAFSNDNKSIALRESLLNKLIFFYHNKGKHDKALKICDTAINYVPNDGILNNKGLILFSCENYTDAIKLFKKAAKFNNLKGKNHEKSAEIWNNLGRAFYRKGDYVEAINNFERAIELNPLYPEAWSNKGLALLELKEYDRALQTLESAIKIYPNNVLAHINLGNLFLTLGDFDSAIRKVNDTLRVSVNDDFTLGQAWCLKGQAQIGKFMYEGAVESFENAISYCPINPTFTLWKSYARYLNNELSSKSKEAKATECYKDVIISIIMDLERTLNYFEKPTEKKVLLSQTSSHNVIKNNKDINDLKIIKAYMLYFLGCLYYKINDSFTAYQKLDECKKLNSKAVKKSACVLKDNIWNYQITPSLSWWNWWLFSLPNTRLKQIVFITLLVLTGWLLELPNFLFKGFSSFISEENQVLYPVLIQFSLLILVLIFVLLSPSIKSIKGKDIEFEMQNSTPPPFELFLCMPPFKFQGTDSNHNIEGISKIISTPIEKITGQWKSANEMK